MNLVQETVISQSNTRMDHEKTGQEIEITHSVSSLLRPLKIPSGRTVSLVDEIFLKVKRKLYVLLANTRQYRLS